MNPMINSNINLNALYYPYADIEKSNSLLLNSLYFDQIYILEPDFFQPPYAEDVAKIPSSVEMLPLVESGIVKTLGPDLLGINKNFGSGSPVLDEENIEFLQKSIQQDSNDPNLRRLVKKYGFVNWEIPTGQQLFWNGLGLLLESTKTSKSEIKIYAERDEMYKSFLSGSGYSSVPIEKHSLKRVRNEYSELQVKVPFLEAESLMINLTLLACAEFNLIPITDHNLHSEFLSAKLSNPKLQLRLKEVFKNLSLPAKESRLAIKSIEINLPNIKGLTAEKVIKLRSSCIDTLNNYKILMRKLRHSIDTEDWSFDLERSIRKIVDIEITPAVKALEMQLISKKRELGLTIGSNIAKLSPLPLLVTIATGFPIELLLGASASLVAFKDYIDYLTTKKLLKHNGLFFLLDLAKATS